MTDPEGRKLLSEDIQTIVISGQITPNTTSQLGTALNPWTSISFGQTTGNGYAVAQIAYAVVTLTDAQIRGMNASPAMILPAPGVGFSYVVHHARLSFIYAGNGAFASGGNLILQYGNTAAGGGQNACNATMANTLLTGTASKNAFVPFLNSSVTFVSTFLLDTTTDNTAIYLSNGSGPFTGGNSSALAVQVFYAIQGS